MINFPNYQIIKQIYESANSLVYQGIRNEDNQSVILKVLREDYPTPEQLTRYRQEYDITRRLLDVDGVVNAYSLEKPQNRLAISLEDFGGESLKYRLAERSFILEELLTLAIQAADILGQIHQKQIIHKDINPANLVFNPSTSALKIIDFGISSVLPRENPTLKNPNQLEGTLAYISPEQTGRMNRFMDYRSDLYSLGVTFYEMFAKQLPFQSKDSMELIHCHIAKIPIPACEINPDVPPILSNIVMKLMAKNVEDRYQSAFGLKADLAKCQENLSGFKKLTLEFELAQNDFSGQFQIPQKLYGREDEIETLLSAFERATFKEKGKAEMMLVAGYSGIGKSALVKEIYKLLTEKRGYFISGKFDQLGRNIPYSGIINAFRELVQQLLTETESQLLLWKNKLLESLGPNGQVITSVLPELELIIGKQPQIPELGPTESQNRFNLVFKNFLKVFCQAEHPLVIFVDDLQWADLATFKLLEIVMIGAEIDHLFVIGAYRDNEVSSDHALMTTLGKLKSADVVVNRITLKPLTFSDVELLIADSLHQNTEMVNPLTDLVMHKTGGNPFFVNQFLKALYEENLLHFDREQLNWQWNLTQIEEMNITDNVVDLMIGKLKKLPNEAQHVLRLASCIGNRFDLNTLSVIYEKSASEIFHTLTPILKEEFVLPISAIELAEDDNLHIQHFQFLHDRVQQAAYALIDDAQKQGMHLQIGRLLLKNTPQEKFEEELFEIVEHLNQGVMLITSQVEKNEIAHLNLKAGQKAKASAAYEAALKYLNVGLQLLAKDSWETEYDLTLSFHVIAMEVEYLNTHFEQADNLAQIILKQSKSVLDKAKIYETQISCYIAQNNLQAAMDAGLQALEILGVSLSESPPQHLVIEELEALPLMTDPYKLIALRIMSVVQVAFYFSQSPSWMPMIFKMVDICVEEGNSYYASFAYVTHGVLLCAVLSDIEKGYQLSQLAMRIHDKFEETELQGRITEMFYAAVSFYKEHAVNTLEPLRDNIRVALENGDLLRAGYSTMYTFSHHFLVGKPLEYVHQINLKYTDFIEKIKQKSSLYYAKVWEEIVMNLMGKTQDRCRLMGRFFNEAEMIPLLEKSDNSLALLVFHQAKTILYYLFKDNTAAVASSLQATKYENSGIGILSTIEHFFYPSLAFLAQYPVVDQATQQEYLVKVIANQEKLGNWAKYAPMNFQHKYDLVEAEKARVLGQVAEAMDLYEKAISGAKDNDYIQNEALAYELAAEFYLGRGMEKIAQTYMKEAHYSYQQWQATAKVEDLEERYPQFFAQKVSMPIQVDATLSLVTQLGSSTQSISNFLDLNSVMKAAQALSGEIVLSKLLDKMMHIVIENAGASVGFLLLPKKEQWVIEAEGHVDSDEVKLLQSTSLGNQQVAETIIQYVARTKENVVLNNATQEGQFIRDAHIVSQCPQSILCVPLINQGKLTGILYLENNLTTGAFTSDRLQVLQMISSQLAVSIENAVLYRTLEQRVEERTAQLASANEEITDLNEQLKSENLRMGAELDVSRQLQQMLLPKEKELTEVEGLDIAGFMEPADEVGGDYYDVLQHDGRVLMGIGDVTGHGLESGALAIMVQSAVRALLANDETDPVKFLSAINEVIYLNVERMDAGKNLTLALVNYQNGELRLSGQHEEMIVVRSGELELIDTIDLGFPIGLDDNIADFISEAKISLNTGDVAVLYTDGITEAENLDKEQYEMERLCEVIKQNWQRTANEIRNAVIDDVKAFIGTQTVFDDITLLVLKQK
ncbi:AAA family ATPase [Candidatus Parabeggiatoa sp. HSG14]|uniref:AAA family ATPase n=1 Tax=Candidatus Parabeggiatoa sp. HSG14 TaxID=3055593 RepID=UPI0025A70F14|nr:AAA family ATPase [Thiotrichales bacterium HSG14]